MAKWHGMRFRYVRDDEVFDLSEVGLSDPELAKRYVHPDSEYLLTPMIGDVMMSADGDFERIEVSTHYQRGKYLVGTGWEIIRRIRTVFFWPEVEV